MSSTILSIVQDTWVIAAVSHISWNIDSRWISIFFDKWNFANAQEKLSMLTLGKIGYLKMKKKYCGN